MKQPPMMSMLETALSTAAGFVLSLLVQWLVLPWLLGVPIPLHLNLVFTLIMTVVSLARQFVLRRVFEALHIRRPMSAFVLAVIAERFRQIEQEGWSVDHDDDHRTGELATAGAAYAKHARLHLEPEPRETISAVPHFYMPNFWPWSPDWWKPAGFRRDLVKSAALIIAEGEKFDRARQRRSA